MALEAVRRQLQHDGAELKGSLWSLRGNAWNLSAERQQQRRALRAQYTKLGRAMSLREMLQAIYASLISSPLRVNFTGGVAGRCAAG